MTRPRITSVEEADALDLEWLWHKGSPRGAVRDLLDSNRVYRDEIHRLRKLVGENKKPGFAERVEARRK